MPVVVNMKIIVKNYILCYENDTIRGSLAISDFEKKDADEYKKKIAIEAKENETNERVL